MSIIYRIYCLLIKSKPPTQRLGQMSHPVHPAGVSHFLVMLLNGVVSTLQEKGQGLFIHMQSNSSVLSLSDKQ